jgi:pseudaminic acid synthase
MLGNHNRSIERAFAIIDAAAAGAHAIKLQTYTADAMTLDLEDGEFVIANQDSLWAGQSLHKLYQQACTPLEWHAPIFARCCELGIICFSTPFDEAGVDFLETLGAPCYKVASFENTDLPLLIRKMAATGKPLIVSTGMATGAELDETVGAICAEGCEQFVPLKCTGTYPADPANSNLRTIPHLRELFQCEVGLSDHTMGVGGAVAAVALGACVLEKHFTLRRTDGGVDAAFSLEPAEMQALVVETEHAWRALGGVADGPTEAERASPQFRRSLYVGQDMKAGEVFTPATLRRIRPGAGLAPKYYELLLGRRVRHDVARRTPLSWDLVL